MNAKVVVGGIVIVIGLILGAVNFFESNVDYGDFADARKSQKKIQIKGEWVKDRESTFDPEKMQFTFYLKDDSGEISKVVLEGPKPNNFDIAISVVIKGKYVNDNGMNVQGYFHASEVLTKCPSKYEGQTGPMKKNS